MGLPSATDGETGAARGVGEGQGRPPQEGGFQMKREAGGLGRGQGEELSRRERQRMRSPESGKTVQPKELKEAQDGWWRHWVGRWGPEDCKKLAGFLSRILSVFLKGHIAIAGIGCRATSFWWEKWGGQTEHL